MITFREDLALCICHSDGWADPGYGAGSARGLSLANYILSRSDLPPDEEEKIQQAASRLKVTFE